MQLASEQALEFDKIRLLLAQCTSTPMGRALAEAVQPSSEIDELRREHARLSAVRRLSDKGIRFDLSAFAQIEVSTPSLPKRKPVLEPLELYSIAAALRDAAGCGQLLQSAIEEDEYVSPLAALAGDLDVEEWLAREVLAAVDAGGEILDDASPELGRLRKAVRSSRSEINKVLRQFFDEAEFPNYVQDDFVTIRGGRLVIPIKTEHRGRFRGIVHDRSRSGDSLFFEPMAAVDLNNTLAELIGETEVEEARILARLTELLYENWEQVARALRAMAELDILTGKTRFADLCAAVEPVFEESNDVALEIRDARHPLLDERLDGLMHSAGISAAEELPEHVVPVDIRVGGEWKVLVVTGPNAGGKTVTLKTAGLLALMAQAGLQVPAKEYRAPVYRTVYADIGDYQDIISHLSTFSSHLHGLKQLFTRMHAPALVLLDEISSATDPGEGSALAMAVLQQLREEGASVIATTHLDAIKAFAHAEDGMSNASVEFDPATMKPTYRLRYGLPGRSNALETAREVGLPEPVLRRAREFLGETGSRGSEIIGKLQDELTRMRSEREALEQQRKVLEESRRHYVKRLDESDAKEQQRLKQIEVEWRDFKQAQEKALAEALEQIKAVGERQAAREAAREARTKRDESYEKLTLKRRKRPERLADDGGPLSEGQPVSVPGLRRMGKVLRAWNPQDGQDVTLEMDGKRLTLPRSAVVRKGSAPKDSGKRRGETKLNVPSASEPSQLELKVIGLKVEEALIEVDHFLDKAVVQGMPWVRIIHGHGTGALRKAISAHLKELPYVNGWGPADAQSGGEAVTVVELVS
jgi:DNA mismatch repair protein MutS2